MSIKSVSKKRKIRILYLIPSLQTGGAEIQLLSLVKGLDKDRFEATVAFFYNHGDLKSEFEKVPHIRLVCLNKRGPFDFTFLLNLFRLVQTEKFDILQAYNVSARFFGMIVAARYRVPCKIMTERNSKPVYSSLGSRIYHFLENKILKYSSITIANSEAGRRFVVSRGVPAARSRVIYNGIDENRLSNTNKPQDLLKEYNIPSYCQIVGMIARMFPQKDPYNFLKAAECVISQKPETRFLLVGDGPILGKVKSFAKSLNLEAFVIFTGNQEHVADFLNVMDVVVLPSRKSEGCSNALIEAMSLGKASIATNIPGNNELFISGFNGLLVPPGNFKELAKNILELLGNNVFLNEIGRNAKNFAREQFSQKTMIQEHQNLYDELLTQS